MNFMNKKALAIAATVAMAISVPSFAQLNNGDMEYGDGGWYLMVIWSMVTAAGICGTILMVQL